VEIWRGIDVGGTRKACTHLLDVCRLHPSFSFSLSRRRLLSPELIWEKRMSLSLRELQVLSSRSTPSPQHKHTTRWGERKLPTGSSSSLRRICLSPPPPAPPVCQAQHIRQSAAPLSDLPTVPRMEEKAAQQQRQLRGRGRGKLWLGTLLGLLIVLCMSLLLELQHACTTYGHGVGLQKGVVYEGYCMHEVHMRFFYGRPEMGCRETLVGVFLRSFTVVG